MQRTPLALLAVLLASRALAAEPRAVAGGIRWVATSETQPWMEKAIVAGASPAVEAALSLSAARYQKVEGFGGCFNEAGWDALAALDETSRQEVLRSLFHPRDGCRFTIGRLPIGASDYALEWYSLNETEGDLEMKHFSIERDRRYLVPYVKAALAERKDLTLFASPWSPPTWMKSPRAYNYGQLRWEKPVLEAYALYFQRFVEAYATEGVPIRQVHVQNEPNSDQKFPSCLWTGEKMRDFIKDHLGPTLRKAGLQTEIWAGTIEREDVNAWANLILSDPSARGFVSGVGYQWAGKGAVQRTRESWPDLRIMQTESECGDGRNSWDYALYVFSLVKHYIGNGANAYVYWNMVLPEGGESTWGWKQNSLITVSRERKGVVYRPEYHVMRHFSQFVDPGAVRVGLAGFWASNALAFENPDGRTVVVVANPFAEVRTLSFGAPAFTASLPPRSFHTFVLPAQGKGPAPKKR